MVRGRKLKRDKEKFELYCCYDKGKLLYVGSGALYRHKHCNSGTSHVYELNKLHFQGFIFDVKVKYFETREDALEEEQKLIREHLPELNKVYTTRNCGKSKWVQTYSKLRKSFTENNKFDKKSTMHRKMVELFEAFLMLHPIPLIDSEGVLLRGRSYYKNRGYTKFESLVKNNRSSNTTTNKVFTNFFSILRISLESVLEKSIEFAWYYERASFKENLISLDEIFADTGGIK